MIFESKVQGDRPASVTRKLQESIISDDLPVLPLRGVVVYPMTWLPLPIGQERSIRLVEKTLPNNRIIALVTSPTEEPQEPNPATRSPRIGTAAQVHPRARPPDGTMLAARAGAGTCPCVGIHPARAVPARPHRDPARRWKEGIEMEALMRAVEKLSRRLVDLEPQMPDELSVMSLTSTTGASWPTLWPQACGSKGTRRRRCWRWTACAVSCCGYRPPQEGSRGPTGRKIGSRQAQGRDERMQRDLLPARAI